MNNSPNAYKYDNLNEIDQLFLERHINQNSHKVKLIT